MDGAVLPSNVVETRNSTWKSRWWVPLGLGLMTFGAMFVDISVATAARERQTTSGVGRLINEWLEICETFGHGFGATLIVIAVFVLDPSKRRYLVLLVASPLGSGMAANLVKNFIPRTRPRDLDLLSITVWDTFVRGSQTNWGMQSFPSAHTATAVGLAVLLSTFYPRGQWYFATLALLVAVQRVAVSAHFPSDVCGGAFVGWIVGTACASFVRPSDALPN